MTVSWASLFGYIQARTAEPVRTVAFLVDVKSLTIGLTVNGTDAKGAPLKFGEVYPILEAYLPTLGVPEAADVLNGSVEIDYVTNTAVVTVYYKHGKRKQRREQRYDFSGGA